MPLQPPQYPGNLDPTNPRGTDSRTISDDVHRNTKESIRMTFANVVGAVTSSHTDLNLVSGLSAAGRKLMTGQGGTTKAVFFNPTAPTGWTIDNTFTADMMVTAGTINGTPMQGGDRTGTDDPGLMDKVPTHTHVADPHRHFVASNSTVTSRGTPSSLTQMAIFLNTNQNDETFLAVGSGDATVHRASETTVTIQNNTGAANWVPKVAAGIVCTLDA